MIEVVFSRTDASFRVTKCLFYIHKLPERLGKTASVILGKT